MFDQLSPEIWSVILSADLVLGLCAAALGLSGAVIIATKEQHHRNVQHLGTSFNVLGSVAAIVLGGSAALAIIFDPEAYSILGATDTSLSVYLSLAHASWIAGLVAIITASIIERRARAIAAS